MKTIVSEKLEFGQLKAGKVAKKSNCRSVLHPVRFIRNRSVMGLGRKRAP